jgi:F0F1-type ATP synthase assembly protein I
MSRASDKLNKNVNQNLTKSIIFMSGANFVTFLILLWVYSVTKEIWFLIAGIAMLVSGVAFMIVVNKYKKKLRKLNERQTKPNEPN